MVKYIFKKLISKVTINYQDVRRSDSLRETSGLNIDSAKYRTVTDRNGPKIGRK